MLSGADCREQRFSPLLRLTTRSDTRLFSTLFPLPLPLLLSLNKTKQNDQRHKKRATHGLEKKSMLCLPCARRSQSPLYLYHAWNTPTCEHSLLGKSGPGRLCLRESTAQGGPYLYILLPDGSARLPLVQSSLLVICMHR